VPPGDARALADAIGQLSGEAALRRRLGRQARLEAEAHHRWQHTAERLEDVFGSVLARARHRPVRG
jgi:glycosyltransferase involved in cell wall biosynthesis